MVTRTTTPQKKKSTSPKKKTVAKVATPKKPVAKKKPVVSEKVDYYPNRMTLAVSVLAGTLLVLFALIAVLGSQ